MIVPVEYIISKGYFEVRDPLLKIKPLLIINTACCLLVEQSVYLHPEIPSCHSWLASGFESLWPQLFKSWIADIYPVDKY